MPFLLSMGREGGTKKDEGKEERRKKEGEWEGAGKDERRGREGGRKKKERRRDVGRKEGGIDSADEDINKAQ